MVTTVGGAAASAPDDSAAAAPYAEVIVDAPAAVPGGAFTYSVPPHLDVRPGHLVRVPFGARTLHGIVVALSSEARVSYTKPIEALVEEAPLFTPERIELGRWLAGYYMAPLFDALAPMLPPGLRTRTQTYVQLSGEPMDDERLSAGARRLLAHLRANPRPHRLSALVKALGPWAQNAVRRAVEAGAVVESQSGPPLQLPAARKQLLMPSQPPEMLRAHIVERPRTTRRGALLGELAASAGGLDASVARKRFGSGTVKAVVGAGLARLDAAPPPVLAPSQPPDMLRAQVVERPRATKKGALLEDLAASAGGLDASDARKRFGSEVVRAVVSAGLARLDAALPPALMPSQPPETLRAHTVERPRTTRRGALLEELAASAGGLDASDARKRFGSEVVRAVVGAGLARLDAAPPPAPAPARPPLPFLLPTADQQAALAAINRSLDDPSSPRVWLLHGVTGSGKTEVYLQSIAHCLSGGRRAIVLVPELALTPQTLARFEARFPGRVGVLHSGLTTAQQAREWRRVFRRERDIVIGPRSALFAPVADLGLIVLDEEHEWTYKQTDASPRYHARDAAEQLGRLTGAVVVLGSATPDVASAYRAERGEIGRLPLPTRIERSGAPTTAADVEVVDMREELREGNRSIFSRSLREHLRATVEAGRQAVLFLNRRGAASVVECRSCGFVMRCSRCSTPLTYHESGGAGRLVCHHCGRRRGVPARCPKCKSDRIRYLGIGTQRLVDEAAAVVPQARVLRWDSDTASSVRAHERLLEAFAGREADVLIGTQMVAKGLDIPSVDLVGVVLADVGLHQPDFRASERAFQLLTQVAGRAGRGPAAGRVVIQTYLPDHYAVRAAAAQDYEAFYETEMEHRRVHRNPPFGRLVRLLYGHTNRDAAHREAARFGDLLHRTLREWDMTETEVIGPAPAYPPRVRNAWRWHILVRAPEPRMLLDKVGVPPAWHADVDPVSVI